MSLATCAVPAAPSAEADACAAGLSLRGETSAGFRARLESALAERLALRDAARRSL